MEWIKANLWEISQSSALKNLGALLALTHILTYFKWSNSASGLFVEGASLPLCWGFLPNCTALNPLSPLQAKILLTTYLVLAIFALLIFFTERILALGWFFLAVGLFINFSFLLLDYTLASNIQTVLLFANFSYLFIPQKVRLIKWIVVASYLTMGLLKLNPDWLAGFWLSDKIEYLPLKGAEWAAALSVMAEMVAPWLLLSRQGQRFTTGVVIVGLYNIISWVFLDHMEPAVFSCFLLFFIVSFFEGKRIERERIYQSYIRPEPSQMWIPVGLLAFAAFQILPLFGRHGAFYENPFRLTAHHVPQKCRQYNFAIFKNEIRPLPEDANLSVSEALHCHPFVRFQAAKSFCHELSKDADFVNVSSFFLSRRISQSEFQRVFEINDVCDEKSFGRKEVRQ